jgi:hypothetical protein
VPDLCIPTEGGDFQFQFYLFFTLDINIYNSPNSAVPLPVWTSGGRALFVFRPLKCYRLMPKSGDCGSTSYSLTHFKVWEMTSRPTYPVAFSSVYLESACQPNWITQALANSLFSSLFVNGPLELLGCQAAFSRKVNCAVDQHSNKLDFSLSAYLVGLLYISKQI